MRTEDVTYDNQAYLRYFSIEGKNFTDKIAYYESNFQYIQDLTEEQKTEVDLDYCLSIFEVGRYHQFLSQCEKMIVSVIEQNIFTLHGEDIYQKLLFKKAACYYNLSKLEDATYVLLELIKIDPSNQMYRTFATKCIRLQAYRKFDTLKGVAMAMILSSLAIITIEILLARTFFPDIAPILEMLRNTLFFSSVGLLFFNEILLRRHIYKKIKGAIRSKNTNSVHIP